MINTCLGLLIDLLVVKEVESTMTVNISSSEGTSTDSKRELVGMDCEGETGDQI